MKKISVLAVSLLSMFAVSQSSFAEGLATGEWTNRHFVDFQYDWQDTVEKAGDIITEVKGDVSSGKVLKKSISVGDGLKADSTDNKLKAVTDGTNVYINASGQITADAGTITVPDTMTFNRTTTTVNVPNAFTFTPTTGEKTVNLDSTLSADGVKSDTEISEVDTTYTVKTDGGKICEGKGAAVNGTCWAVYTGQSVQGDSGDGSVSELDAHTVQGQNYKLSAGKDSGADRSVFTVSDLSGLKISGTGTATLPTGGSVSISGNQQQQIGVTGEIVKTTTDFGVLVPRDQAGRSTDGENIVSELPKTTYEALVPQESCTQFLAYQNRLTENGMLNVLHTCCKSAYGIYAQNHPGTTIDGDWGNQVNLDSGACNIPSSSCSTDADCVASSNGWSNKCHPTHGYCLITNVLTGDDAKVGTDAAQTALEYELANQ